MNDTARKIYKIITRQQWDVAQADGIFRGAPVDIKDGYIHFSSAKQVRETAAKHFNGQKNLLLVSVNPDDFPKTLKWEQSRGGDLFPHLYDVLPVSSAIDVSEIGVAENGSHVFPEQL